MQVDPIRGVHSKAQRRHSEPLCGPDLSPCKLGPKEVLEDWVIQGPHFTLSKLRSKEGRNEGGSSNSMCTRL